MEHKAEMEIMACRSQPSEAEGHRAHRRRGAAKEFSMGTRGVVKHDRGYWDIVGYLCNIEGCQWDIDRGHTENKR